MQIDAGEVRPLDLSRVTLEGSNLTFTSLTRTDQGTYECVASNMLTNVTANTSLFVEGGCGYRVGGASVSYFLTNLNMLVPFYSLIN